MIRADDDNAVLSKGRQRLILLLPILFLLGQFLNLALTDAAIGWFKTNDLADAWMLVLCIYTGWVARCCVPVPPAALRVRAAAEASFGSIASFLALSSVVTVALAVLTGALVPSGDMECAIVIGCACQVIAFVAMATIGFGEGRIVGGRAGSFAIALGLSLAGSGAIWLRQTTSNLGVVLPAIVLLAWAARDIKFASRAAAQSR